MKPEASDSNDELLKLIGLYCDSELSDDETERLRELLLADQRNLDTFLEYLELHAHLHRKCSVNNLGIISDSHKKQTGDNLKPDMRIFPFSNKGISRSIPGKKRNTRIVVTVAAMVLLCVGLLLLVTLTSTKTPTPKSSFAVIAEMRNVQWPVGTSPLSVGDRVTTKTITINQGLMKILMDSGHIVIVEGPAEIQIESAARAYLNLGRLYCDFKGNSPFIIETPHRRIQDQGTQVGIEVQKGYDLVQVYEGKVLIQSKKTDTTIELESMNARQISSEDVISKAPFAIHRFVKHLAKNEGMQDWPARDQLPPQLNSTTHTEIRVPHRRWPIRVDGRLEEWKQIPSLSCNADATHDDTRGMTGSLQYDRDYLYLAVRVKDPYPLRNMIDPHLMPQLAENGGSVQLRISTNRKKGWPANKAVTAQPRNNPRWGDNKPHLHHLTLWNFRETETPCLTVNHVGEDRKFIVNPSGVQAAYKKHEDGKGYTMECAIPWTVLECENDPPRAGDVLPFCWQITWSGKNGRVWHGQIVDILNPAASGSPSQNPNRWGRAVFLPL